MKLYWLVARHTVQTLLILFTLAGAGWTVWQALKYTLPAEAVFKIKDSTRKAFGLTWSPEAETRGRFWAMAFESEADHTAISDWALHCMKVESTDVFPYKIKQLFNWDPLQMEPSRIKPTITELHPTYYRALRLSKELIDARLDAREQLLAARESARKGAYAAIIIGFFTTVCVGLSAMPAVREAPRLTAGLKVAAFVLPAFGTAVAAIIAFDDPAAQLARQTQVVAGLKTLHDNMADAILSIPCATNQQDSDATGRLAEWTKRLNDIQANKGEGAKSGGGAESKGNSSAGT
jgi:hypothetical protein